MLQYFLLISVCWVSCSKLTLLCCALVAARYFLLVFPGELEAMMLRGAHL